MKACKNYCNPEEKDDAEEDTFYDRLQNAIDKIPGHDLKLFVGDFNDCDKGGLELIISPHRSAAQTNNPVNDYYYFVA